MYWRGVKRLSPVLAALLLFGCEASRQVADDSRGTTLAATGSAASFNHPRGIAADEANGLLYVLDRSAIVRKLTIDGEFRASWQMPDSDKGSPEDLCVGSDGNIRVADTHYSRVVMFSPQGEILMKFGSYGTEDGQFIYPVGICLDPDGNIYVADYGQADRIQKFSAQGEHLATWAGFGEEKGRLQRPAGMNWHDHRVYVADSCNHRIQVFHDDGRLERVIGSHGTEPGQFRYPYDVETIDDRVFVLEYGSQRVQVLTLAGTPIGQMGSSGRGSGQLFLPWRMTTAGGKIYVADTNNNRIIRYQP